MFQNGPEESCTQEMLSQFNNSGKPLQGGVGKKIAMLIDSYPKRFSDLFQLL